MKIFSFLNLIFSLFLISCGAGDGNVVNNSLNRPSGVPMRRDIFTETDRDKRLVDNIDDFYVSCEYPMECPSYMAMLVWEFRRDFQYAKGRCSSFLVSPDVLATNAHCIPDDLKEGDSCVDRIFALFPESQDKKEERVGCEKILSKFRNEDLGFDYAFIKLDRIVDREIPEIDFGVRTAGMAIKIWKVDPFDNNFGMVRKGSCELFNDSFFYSDFHSPFSPSLSFWECESVKGNSGSPLLNSKGKVIGINWGATENYRPEIDSFRDLIPDRHFEFLHFGTNFGCLCKKGETYTHHCENLPESCSNGELGKLWPYQNSLLKKKAKEFLTEKEFLFLEGIREEFSENFIEWEFGFFQGYKTKDGITEGRKFFASLFPKCIKSYEGLITESSEVLIDSISNRFLLIPGTTICEIDVTFNSKLQVVGMKVNQDKCISMDSRIEFNYTKEIEGTPKGPVLNIWWGYEYKEGVYYPVGGEFSLGECSRVSEGAVSVSSY